MHLTTLTAWAALTDGLLFYLLFLGTSRLSPWWQCGALGAFSCFVFTTKWIKLIGHYSRYPNDIWMLPLSILFGYAHNLIKLYAMCTLNEVSKHKRRHLQSTVPLPSFWQLYMELHLSPAWSSKILSSPTRSCKVHYFVTDQ